MAARGLRIGPKGAVVAVVLAAATLGALVLWRTGTSVHSVAAASPEAHGAGWTRLDADEPAPAFSLTDHNGQRVALADLRGKVAILTFLFTQCIDVCPVLPQILARVDEHLSPAQKAQLVFVGISIDARRDTPPRLLEFMARRGLDDTRWRLLTGSVAELTQAADDYGVVVRPDPRLDFVHNSVFVLVDGAGRLRSEFHGLATPSRAIADAAIALMN
jgi:protein SCO1/2